MSELYKDFREYHLSKYDEEEEDWLDWEELENLDFLYEYLKKTGTNREDASKLCIEAFITISGIYGAC